MLAPCASTIKIDSQVEQDSSQKRLAIDSGVERSYLGGVERGEENPTIDVLDRIAATLSIHVSELVKPVAQNARQPAGLKPGRKPSR